MPVISMPVVTLLVAGLHGLLLLVLLWPIVRTRRSQRIGLGDGGNPVLLRRIRVHANFVEYVPMALVLLALVEMSGAPRFAVAVLGGTLFVARIAHAIGLLGSGGYSIGRFWGTLLTWGVLLATSAVAVARAFNALQSG